MMLVARAFAKINLGLEILAKRADGYHELRTILQTIDFGDELTFRTAPDGRGGIQLTTNRADVPVGSENLVYRAAALVADLAPRGSGVAIHLDKRVPPGMGLGGGSTDAAVTLLALDRLWGLELAAEQLHRLASSLGMDVPFFLRGGTALAVGRGDEVFPLGLELDWPIVLILPDFAVSTAEAYANLRLTRRQSELTLLQNFSWRSPSVQNGLGELVNHLEGATGEHCASIRKFKQRLLECGARGSMMAGSGSAVFGVFQDVGSAQRAADALRKDGPKGLFVSMPSKKRKDGTFRDIAHPLNSDTRRRMEHQILTCYRKEVSDGDELESRVLPEGAVASEAPPPPGPSGEL